VSELPIQFRLDAANLMQLQAGVNDAGSITGARSDQGNITLDGLDINDQATGQAFTSTIPVSVDALQEIRTVTAGETADYGRSSGGGINLVTKSGTNNRHGNLREYNRSTPFAANDWFDNRSGVPRPSLNRNQFGGNLGGPIRKDKAFFFFDYEGLRRSSGTRTERAVPTPQYRAGQLGYINSNPGCTGTARFLTKPNCITYLTPAQVAQIDPKRVGDNLALLSFVNGRYPSTINDPSGFGDGINTGGFGPYRLQPFLHPQTVLAWERGPPTCGRRFQHLDCGISRGSGSGLPRQVQRIRVLRGLDVDPHCKLNQPGLYWPGPGDPGFSRAPVTHVSQLSLLQP
jgi:hypothetical protein